MKKQKFLAIALVAGFVYFLGTTLHSQTTYDDKNCKCCGEECIANNCCSNCVTGEAQGVSTADCCANCTSEECKNCCASGCAMRTSSSDNMNNTTKEGCMGTGSCCSATAGATTNKDCCGKQTK